jgi:hypothetical protein
MKEKVKQRRIPTNSCGVKSLRQICKAKAVHHKRETEDALSILCSKTILYTSLYEKYVQGFCEAGPVQGMSAASFVPFQPRSQPTKPF